MRLPELRQQDLRLISDLTADMMACQDFIELENCLHANLRNIVDGDVSIWNLINTNGTIVYGSTWPQFGEKFWGEIAPVISKNILQHPMLIELTSKSPDQLVNLNSDCPTYKRYLNSEIYSDAYAKWSCLDQCQGSLLAESGTYLNFSVNRSSRTFSLRDLQAFKLLTPLVAKIFGLIKRRQILELEIAEIGNNSIGSKQFWLVISSLLYIRNGSPNAQTMLRSLFPGQFSLVDLPDLLNAQLRMVLATWVPGADNKRQFNLETERSRVECELEQLDPLTFKLTGTLPDRSIEKPTEPLSHFVETKLSARELDVLAWTIEGKLSPEIGIILGIQPKTVEKHLQAIYEKLGVHTRADVIKALGPGEQIHA